MIPTMKKTLLVLIGIGVLAVMAVPVYLQIKERHDHNACMANLKMIDSATESWAMEGKRGYNESPAKKDLYGPTLYIKVEPKCPSGGVYAMGTPTKAPTCSHPGHELIIDPRYHKGGKRFPATGR
jgi:competence protein ComGC